MSLYALQKFLYHLNRDARVQQRWSSDRDALLDEYDLDAEERAAVQGGDMRATRPDALVLNAAEHFANFFMDNMPAYAIGMADAYEGPIEDPQWLGIAKTRIPGNAALSRRLIREVMHSSDVAYAEEWKF